MERKRECEAVCVVEIWPSLPDVLDLGQCGQLLGQRTIEIRLFCGSLARSCESVETDFLAWSVANLERRSSLDMQGRTAGEGCERRGCCCGESLTLPRTEDYG